MKKLTVIKTMLLLLCMGLSFAAIAVNVNKANADQISEALKGIGATKAAAIVLYRKNNGPFKSMKDLTLVKGIGAATVDKNRENIQLK